MFFHFDYLYPIVAPLGIPNNFKVMMHSSSLSALQIGAVFSFFLLQLFQTRVQAQPVLTTENPTPKISVVIEPNVLNSSTMIIRITNRNKTPITVLNHYSPFETHPLSHALFSVTPEGNPPRELYFPARKHAFLGKPKAYHLIDLDPGKNHTHIVDFKNPVRNTCVMEDPMPRVWTRHLGKKAKVQLRGECWCVWTKSTREVMLLGEKWEESCHRGKFFSNIVETTLT